MAAPSPTVEQAQKILDSNAEIENILQLHGVVRISLDTYSQFGSSESKPVFVVHATSDFNDGQDRSKISSHIEGVRVIMDYTAAAEEEELFVPDEPDQDEEMESEEDDEDSIED